MSNAVTLVWLLKGSFFLLGGALVATESLGKILNQGQFALKKYFRRK